VIMASRKRSVGDSAGGAEHGVIVWEVDNVADLSSNGRLSAETEVEGLPWKLLTMRTPQDGADFLCVALAPMTGESNLWRVDVEAALILKNEDEKQDVTMKFARPFAHDATPWGFTNFLEWATLTDPAKGFIKDDKITLEARLSLKNVKGFRKIPRVDFADSNESCHDVALIIEGKKLHVN
ncbi:hypothetical protein PFISCL1PPCAC_21209, partial [Pristionchus fissidentatus]